MGILRSLDVSASGLTAQRLRLDVIANNIANVNSTRGSDGGPYRRHAVVMSEKATQAPTALARMSLGPLGAGPLGGGSDSDSQGVLVSAIVPDPTPMRLEYNPGHPDANAEGYVLMPNVNIVTEMVDMVSATRAYEANVTAMNAAKSMAVRALEIGRS